MKSIALCLVALVAAAVATPAGFEAIATGGGGSGTHCVGTGSANPNSGFGTNPAPSPSLSCVYDPAHCYIKFDQCAIDNTDAAIATHCGDGTGVMAWSVERTTALVRVLPRFVSHVSL